MGLKKDMTWLENAERNIALYKDGYLSSSSHDDNKRKVIQLFKYASDEDLEKIEELEKTHAIQQVNEYIIQQENESKLLEYKNKLQDARRKQYINIKRAKIESSIATAKAIEAS